MDTLEFSVQIHAPRERVWKVLWSDEGYRNWTAAFTEGSYAESDWQQGSPIRFLSPGGNGMFGIIQEMVPHETMVFEHQGEVRDGVEQKMDWAGARERYYLQEAAGGTELRVVLDINEEHREYFEKTFPLALEKVRQLSEQ